MYSLSLFLRTFRPTERMPARQIPEATLSIAAVTPYRGSLHHPDELREPVRIGAQRLRCAVVDDVALVEDDGARREGQRHAAVLLDQDDRQRAVGAQLCQHRGQRLDDN